MSDGASNTPPNVPTIAHPDEMKATSVEVSTPSLPLLLKDQQSFFWYTVDAQHKVHEYRALYHKRTRHDAWVEYIDTCQIFVDGKDDLRRSEWRYLRLELLKASGVGTVFFSRKDAVKRASERIEEQILRISQELESLRALKDTYKIELVDE